MKCPNCGGENSGNYCQFCGSEMPKTTAPVNITNNFFGSNSDDQVHTVGGACCPQCGSSKIGFKRERTGTNSKSSSRKKYVGTGRKGTYNSTASYRTIGLCQNCGYTWSPNSNSGTSTSSSNTPTWVWVLGWIFIFPLPLTVILNRKKDMNKSLKYGIIAAAWLLYLIILVSSRSNKKNNPADNNGTVVESATTTSQISDTTASEMSSTTTETTLSKEDELSLYIDNIVESYNAKASEPLVYVEDFTPSNKESGHYRTEFRLNAWSDALGKSYTLGDKVVDIVADPDYQGVGGFRVYADDLSIEQVHALAQGMSPLMDETLSAADLNDALNKVDNDGEANGFYYGDLGMTLFKRSENGYELMIKRD